MDKRKVMDAERGLITALQNNDVANLESKLHADLFFRIPNGEMVGKIDHVEDMKTGDLQINTLTIRDQQIQIVEDVATISVYKDMLGSYKDSPFEGSFHYIRIWKLIEGELKVISGAGVQL